MGDLSRSTDGDILREFFKRAIQVVKDNKEHFLQYNALLGDEQFQSDRETVISILSKYYKKKLIFNVYLDTKKLMNLQDI